MVPDFEVGNDRNLSEKNTVYVILYYFISLYNIIRIHIVVRFRCIDNKHS